MRIRLCSLATLLLLLGGPATAQVLLRGRVVDRSGRGVPGIAVACDRCTGESLSSADGDFSLPLATAPTAALRVTAHGQGIAPATGTAPAAGDLVLVVSPSVLHQQANVTATRSGVEMGPTAVTQTVLAPSDLQSVPALTLDEELRQKAGFELFRRSSGWVQNPTSQGISLRGLGSTAASRSLVLANSAPLNDPFGGWVHWNELPPETIEAVTITSGGGSDLYGSSALGGVIDVVPAHPEAALARGSLAAAGEDTRLVSARGDLAQGRWQELAAAEDFRTAGYILTAPAARGAVDVPANVHFEDGRVEGARTLGGTGRAFLTANVLNEARGNGTPLTTNGTRLWRYLVGDDWAAGVRVSGRLRLFGDDEAYRQSFSAIASGRGAETLSRVQRVGAQEVGASADASFHVEHLALVAGFDTRDLRATDLERPTAGAMQNTTSRQRFAGGFIEGLAEHGAWSGSASLRIDHAANLATRQFVGAAATVIPDRSEMVASPRLGVVRQLGARAAIHASAFRAFRTPTMNELYRTGQVGQETTLPNAALVSERATGTEAGATVQAGRVAAQAAYFWTEVNRPVAAVVQSTTATTILEMRQNLGQFQSQGIELSVEANQGRAVSATLGYQYAHAVVTQFPAQATLVGRWIPEVARQSATAQVRLRRARWGDLTVAGRQSGRAFDDSANRFILHAFFQLDAFAQRAIGRGFTAFAETQNLLDRRADVARTPVLTQGIPLTVQGGVRFGWGAVR